MRKLLIVVVIASAMASLVPISPASAGSDTWGFHGAVQLGSDVLFGLASQSDWNRPRGPESIATGDTTADLPRAIACTRNLVADRTAWLLDGAGARMGRATAVAGFLPGRRYPAIHLHAAIRPGTYYIQALCVVDDVEHSACLRIEIASGPSVTTTTVDRGDRLRSDRCPSGAPSPASPDRWGFYYRNPESGPPGAEPPLDRIGAALVSQAEWNLPYDAATATIPPDELPSAHACALYQMDHQSLWLLDTLGRTVVRGETYGAAAQIVLPASITPGHYVVRAECVVDGDLHAACIGYDVTARGTATVPSAQLVDRGRPLINQSCPRAPWSILSGTAARLIGVMSVAQASLLVLRSPVPIGTPVTTTTTRPAGQPGGGAPSGGGGGGGGGQPAPDTKPPAVDMSVSGDPNCNFVVGAYVTDNVGVSGPVEFSYKGPESGGGTLSGSAPNYSGKFSVQTPGTYTVTVIARDAAGNVGTDVNDAFC